MKRRLDAGPLIAVAGALLLLVSLFTAWYEPSLEAWDIFEFLDLLLAALAITGALAALALIVDLPSAPDGRWLGWSAAAALVLVVATLLDSPPAVGDQDIDVGLWLALAGSALMAAGALLGVARVSITFDVAARERRDRVAAVRAEREEAAADPAPRGGSLLTPDEAPPPPPPPEPTEPLPPTRTETKPKGDKAR